MKVIIIIIIIMDAHLKSRCAYKHDLKNFNFS